MPGGRRLDLRKSTLVANLKKEKQQQQRIQPKTMETSKNSKPITQTTSWPEKYHPRSCTEVVVPKKKAEVMIDFLEKQSSKTSKRPAVLFLVGPSGSGKASTFVTLAKEKCFSVLEWKPPAPAIYNENVSTTSENRFDGGDAYTSKIEDFVNFLNRSTKYNAIVSNVIGGGNKRSRGTVILIRDVPTVAQGDERGRSKFVASIEGLVSSSAKNRIPVVFSSSSDVGEGDFVSFGNESKSDGLKFVRRIIHEKLERMGAQNRQNLSEYLVEIKLNPCTKKSLEDAAKRVINLEFSSEMTKNGSFLKSLPDEDDDFDGLSSIKSRMLENVENLVLECNGDVRSLMFSLQLLYARIVGDMYAKRKKNEKKNTKKRNREEARIDNADGDKERKKESSISLFHALGKFLYAKRKPSDDALESEVEITLNRARVDAAPKTVIDFLFENTPDFIDNRKIDALSQFLKHVSDADVFSCGSQRRKYGDGDQSQSLMLDRLASSVAARGCVSVQSRTTRIILETVESAEQIYYEGSFEAFVATNLPFKKIIEEGYRRNEDRIISDSLFTREDIDEMDNSLEDVEEEDIIEDVD
ncbi:unnamed protein product [Bathycoccus prasinos]